MEKLPGFIQTYKKYAVEAALIAVAIVVSVYSSVLYFMNTSTATTSELPKTEKRLESVPEEVNERNIIIDISGAVMKPDSYELPATARLKDALAVAGGLSELVDRDFFYRNFNLSRQLSDQEKVYIPSVTEISLGIFKENYRLVDFTDSVEADVSPSNGKISINSATLEELDSLPSIGQTTAEKIIQGRPYTALEELTTKDAVGDAVFAKIKELIQL